MKLISILHKYIEQAILYKPLAIQHSTRIFRYVFPNTFQYYSGYISVNVTESPHLHILIRPHTYEI